MPAQRQQSKLASRLGDKVRQVFENAKHKDPEYDSQAGLPGGIEGGVAQLVDCKFLQVAAGKANAGKDMFYAAGIVVSPHESGGVNLIGLRTQISEPLYATPSRSRKTVDDHLEWIMNQLKVLGIDMAEMTIDDLEDVAVTLKEQQPYFRFRTWAGTKQEIEGRGGKFFVGTKGPYATEGAAKAANPFAGSEPRVQHTWNGSCEHVESEEDAEAVVDETPPVTKPGKKSGKKPVKTSPSEEAEDEDVDLISLATAADDEKDEDAVGRLVDIAKAAGVDEDAINGAESWASVVGMIQREEESPVEDEDEDESAEDDWEPEKGEVYPFKAPDKRKAVDCEVTAVFKKSQTVNLKNLTDSKVYRAVAWDKLDSAS